MNQPPILTSADQKLVADLQKPDVKVVGRARLLPVLALVQRLASAVQLARFEAVNYQHLATGLNLAARGQLTAEQIEASPMLTPTQKQQCHELARLHEAQPTEEQTSINQA